MTKEIFFNCVLILGLILLANLVHAVPAAPSPTCKINAEILNATFHEAYFREDGGMGCGSGNISEKYLLNVKINDVSSVRKDGSISCAELYPLNSEKTLTVYKNITRDLFKVNQVIEGEIHFGGDECGGGIYLYDYKIKSNNEDAERNKALIFFSRFWSWIKSIFR